MHYSSFLFFLNKIWMQIETHKLAFPELYFSWRASKDAVFFGRRKPGVTTGGRRAGNAFFFFFILKKECCFGASGFLGFSNFLRNRFNFLSADFQRDILGVRMESRYAMTVYYEAEQLFLFFTRKYIYFFQWKRVRNWFHNSGFVWTRPLSTWILNVDRERERESQLLLGTGDRSTCWSITDSEWISKNGIQISSCVHRWWTRLFAQRASIIYFLLLEAVEMWGVGVTVWILVQIFLCTLADRNFGNEKAAAEK